METEKKRQSKKLKIYAIIATTIILLILAAFILVFHHAGYDEKLLVKLGFKEQTSKINEAVLSWERCLEKLEYDADVVFFGDSITCLGDFQKYFPNIKICNLGHGGDSLSGMINRISMIQSVNPEKVFLLGGINGLTDLNLDNCVSKYAQLLDLLEESLPDTEIYIQSVLPISSSRELSKCHNTTIERFNDEIKKLAEAHKMEYINLYSLYELNGEMNSELTFDGVHIKHEAYDLWAEKIIKYIIN